VSQKQTFQPAETDSFNGIFNPFRLLSSDLKADRVGQLPPNSFVIAKAFEPYRPFLPTKPRKLPLGVIPDVLQRPLDRACKRSFASQVFANPSVPMCSKGVRILFYARSEQMFHFLDQAVFKVPDCTVVYPGIQCLARRIQYK
jgi:hypothetical protein